jgi:hypothetical protein
MINNPSAIVVGAGGELYVFDGGNQKLKRISADPTRAVTTLAGRADVGQGFADGPGTQARFRAQLGMACTPEGALLIADTANFRLRQVVPGTDAASTWVTTVAGSGRLGTALGTGAEAELSIPAGVAVMPDGASYLVTDAFNNLIRRVVR